MVVSHDKKDKKKDGKQVLHLLTSLDFGGVEKRMEILAKATEESTWQHHFCAINKGGFAADRLIAMGASVNCLHKSARIPSLATIWALFGLFQRLKPDVVHTHGAEANFHGLIAAKWAGVPVRIGEEIGIPSHSEKAKKIFRLVYKLAHRVIGISNSVTDWLVKSGEVSKDKAIRIYNPVDLPDERKVMNDHTNKGFRIGFVGRLEVVKNPVALIEAAAVLVNEHKIPAELWLVGDGSQRDMLEQRARKLAILDRTKFFGYQASPEKYIKQCDIYAQPSLSEGFGLALVEAMGCGVPVIATAVGGAPEIIEQNRTGWLINETTPDALTEALTKAWRQRETLGAMGIAARQTVLGRFDAAIYIQQLEQLYQAVFNANTHRS